MVLGKVGSKALPQPRNMMKPFDIDHAWDERTSASEPTREHTGAVFESLFQRSADAIWLYDPKTFMLMDCNQAAVELIGAQNRRQLLSTRPENVWPRFQPD